jgi:DNA polymerase IV
VRIAFIHIPRFACAVEVQREPQLTHQPLIVDDADQPQRVLDCSQIAEQQGVRHGMTIRQALGLCPDAAVIAPDSVLYHIRWDALLDALESISPEVEDDELGRAYLNAGGLVSHYGDEQALAAHILEAVRGASGLEAAFDNVDSCGLHAGRG